jgi:hypothetical protein
MPSRYIETWEAADGTKFELLGLRMTSPHFQAPQCQFQLPWIRRVWVSGFWRATSSWSHVRPNMHVMICSYISHHLFFAYYIASGLNVKLVLQAMVERNASQRQVEEVACSMVPKNN